ncbi:MAG: hypothetical protein ACK5LR_02850 [Mangrovibacterium sp.]
MNIPKISPRVRIDALAFVGKELCRQVETSAISDEELHASANDLKSANQTLLFTIVKDTNISVLEDYEEQRWDAALCLYDYLQMCALRNPSLGAAAGLISIIENHGADIETQLYAMESAVFKSLILDLEKAQQEYSIDAMVQVPKLIENLKASHENFEVAYQSYLDELEKCDGLQESMSLKSQVRGIINNQLVGYLNDQLKYNPEKYKKLARQMTVAVEFANRLRDWVEELNLDLELSDDSGEGKVNIQNIKTRE